jgi:NCS2 family nucleobase:cation symporter-2
VSAPDADDLDKLPPLRALAPLGIQHVLAMYAGAVAVPLIIGNALDYSDTQVAYLINADLFVAGVATVIQSLGFWRFGVRLPLVQGVSFAAVGPLISIGHAHGATAMFGATIASGVFMLIAAPFFAQLLRFFPPVVTGTVVLIIGLSLMAVAARWVADRGHEGAARPIDVGFAAGTVVLILLVERFAPPALRRISVLLGLVLGTLTALLVPGMVDWSRVPRADWVAVVAPFHAPFHYGLPTFSPAAIVSMLVVALVIMTETSGDMLAIGEIVGRPITRRRLADGLRADGLGTIIGGVFNTFPYTGFAQNVGLVSLSRVRSRYVATAAGVLLILLGLLPKAAAVVAGVPTAVLGGAGIALFGMVAAAGIRTLTTVRFDSRSVLIVAIPIGVALLPTVQPTLYDAFPRWFTEIFSSGISAGALTAIVLNLLFGRPPRRGRPLS